MTAKFVFFLSIEFIKYYFAYYICMHFAYYNNKFIINVIVEETVLKFVMAKFSADSALIITAILRRGLYGRSLLTDE